MIFKVEERRQEWPYDLLSKWGQILSFWERWKFGREHSSTQYYLQLSPTRGVLLQLYKVFLQLRINWRHTFTGQWTHFWLLFMSGGNRVSVCCPFALSALGNTALEPLLFKVILNSFCFMTFLYCAITETLVQKGVLLKYNVTQASSPISTLALKCY